ncbi:MAG TPA: threonine--tRNA ligase [Thermoplasmata archaeon]|nr:threonine--tRNA ligase [Thermoplasmata archaeon]
MRVLFIHADRIEWEARETAARVHDDVPAAERKKRIDEALVCFTAVEKSDEESSHDIVAPAVQAIQEIAGKVKATRVVIYPYAHLSANLSSLNFAYETLKKLEVALSAVGGEVVRAPFGWYKSFDVACKGHPLSELSKEIVAGPAPAPEGKHEEKKPANVYLILHPDGRIEDVTAFKLTKGDNFSTLVEKEALKRGRELSGEPKYLRICKKFGIEWEEMSDSGHMRYGPKATLMFDLASAYATQIVMGLDFPVLPVRGTNMFDLEQKAVKEHAELFGDRLYQIRHGDEGRSFVLRYAACHQQFAMVKDWTLSYKQLPFGAFEVADAYRLEQSGECLLCFRTRRMNMPDLHVFTADLEGAKLKLEYIHDRIFDEIKKLGRDYEILVNAGSRKWFDENKDWVASLLRRGGVEKKGLVNVYPEVAGRYWVLNIEYNIIDAEGKEREIGTVQIDVGNAARFGIEYADDKGGKHRPVILHTAIIGTLERYLYTLFDTAMLAEAKGKTGSLPLWINPEQVRLLPVGERHMPKVTEMRKTLEAAGLRVGVDDRPETVGKKVREAKQDWVGVAIVIGDKELDSAMLRAYDREADADRDITLGDLVEDLKKRTDGYPKKGLYFPAEVSRRPGFR